MNYKKMGQFIAMMLAVFMVPALFISLFSGELSAVRGFLTAMAATAGAAALLYALCRKAQGGFYAR